jgi:hypothetical protein
MKYKSIVIFIIGVIFIAFLNNKPTSAYVGTNIQININGKKVESSILLIKSTVFVPVEFFNSNPKLTFGFIKGAKPKLIILESNDYTLYLTVGSKSVKKNEKNIELLTPPFIKNGHTWIPLRFVTESFDLKVTWDQKTKTVSIQAPNNTNQ